MPKVNIGDIDLYYVCYQDEVLCEVDLSKKTLIVHHGGMGFLDHQIELEPWKPFSKDLQVIFIDQRGCGQSDDGDGAKWTMNQFGDDIVAFAKALGLEKPIVGGVSSGGYASLACATRHPDFPGGLILLNTEPVVSPEMKRDAYFSQGKREDKREFAKFKSMTDEEITAFCKHAGAAVFNYDKHPAQDSERNFFKYGFDTISKNNYHLTEAVRVNKVMKAKFKNGYGLFDYSKEMGEIACPVLWFAGTYDPLHPCAGAQEAAKKVQQCELKVVEAGAPIYCDAPREFYQGVRDFFTHTLRLADHPICRV